MPARGDANASRGHSFSSRRCVVVCNRRPYSVVALSIFVNVKINSKRLKSKKKGNLHTAIGLESWAFFCDAAAVVVRPLCSSVVILPRGSDRDVELELGME